MLLFTFFICACNTRIEPTDVKPRILITADGEVDDMNGFIRFLLYSNEFDIATVKDFNPYTREWNQYWPQLRWVEFLQNDFAARAERCVKNFEKANHPPVVRLNHPNELSAGIGQQVNFSGNATDPDGDQLKYRWWQYLEAGTYRNNVSIENANSKDATLIIPNDARAGDTVHIILEVTDSGTPHLARFQRLVVNVLP